MLIYSPFLNRDGASRLPVAAVSTVVNSAPSLAVKGARLSWYWHSRGVGDHGVLDYLVKAEHMSFRQAVETVTGITPATVQARQEAEPPRALILPEKVGIPLRLYDYLCCKCGIDSETINTLIQEERLYADRRGNVVFVGRDEHGKVRFASLRGTYGDCRFRMDCPGSNKRYGFNMEASVPSERLYVYESPIDAMSHGSLVSAAAGNPDACKQHNRLSLAGTSYAALSFFLNQRPSVRELVLCLDNDPAGIVAASTIARKYADNGYMVQFELSKGKDFNEDLQARVKRIQAV